MRVPMGVIRCFLQIACFLEHGMYGTSVVKLSEFLRKFYDPPLKQKMENNCPLIGIRYFLGIWSGFFLLYKKSAKERLQYSSIHRYIALALKRLITASNNMINFAMYLCGAVWISRCSSVQWRPHPILMSSWSWTSPTHGSVQVHLYRSSNIFQILASIWFAPPVKSYWREMF